MLRTVALFILFTGTAQAAIGDRFGFTSESAATAGARVGLGEMTSASSFENPAQMSLDSGKTARFHWSVLYSEPKFADIRGVVTENSVNSDKATGTSTTGGVSTKYPATFGQSLGFSVRSEKSSRHWGLGAVVYLPLDRLALIDSGETFVPEYTLHRGRTQKPEFQFALSGLIAPKWSLGVGVYLGARLTSDTTLFLNQGAGSASSMRISSSLKTQASPFFGLTFIPDPDFSFGLVVRFASSVPATLNVQAGARAIGSVSALDFGFPAIGTMYYDPFTVSLGSSWRYAGTRSLSIQVDYQAWGSYRSPVLVIQNSNTTNCSPACGVDFASGLDLATPTRDLIIPRIGHSWDVGPGTIRSGYTYRQGIYRSLPEGAGNAIDPDEHRLSAGYGWDFTSFLVFDAPGRLDFHTSYSLYPKKSVVKSAGDENGNTANSKIGAPGYEIGGNEWGTGITLGLYL